mgnify:CR=1 FL=1
MPKQTAESQPQSNLVQTLNEEGEDCLDRLRSMSEQRAGILEQLSNMNQNMMNCIQDIDRINEHLNLEGAQAVQVPKSLRPSDASGGKGGSKSSRKSSRKSQQTAQNGESIISQQVAAVLDMYDTGIVEEGRSRKDIANSAQNRYPIRPSMSQDIVAQMFLHTKPAINAGIIARTGPGKYSITKKGIDKLSGLDLDGRVKAVRSIFSTKND